MIRISYEISQGRRGGGQGNRDREREAIERYLGEIYPPLKLRRSPAEPCSSAHGTVAGWGAVLLLGLEQLKADWGVRLWGLQGGAGPQSGGLGILWLSVLTKGPGARRLVFTKPARKLMWVVDTSYFLKCGGTPPAKEFCKQQIRRIEG